jgi:simple sugar transport system permease protein
MAPNQSIPWSAQIAESSIIPKILPHSPLHAGIIFVFIAAAVVYYVLWHTTWGYELRSVGINTEASEYGGIKVKRVRILTIVFSGVLASLAGSMEILGAQFRLQSGFLVNYGYYGIPVALLGGLHPLGTLLAAFFFGALFNGATTMQATTGIPVSIVGMVQALAIFGVIGISGIQKVFLSKRTHALGGSCDS